MAVSREMSWKAWPDERILEAGAHEMGLRIQSQALEMILKYFFELKKWNRKINLIGPGEIKEQIIIHLLDALGLLIQFDDEYLNFADVGSGGGIPGLVLKIARPGWTGILIEARSKRCGFLRHIIRQFQLEGIKVHEGRLTPDACHEIGKPFDMVTMRGLAALDDIIKLTTPLLATKGCLAAYKGPQYQDEIEESSNTLSVSGLAVEKIMEYQLPFLNRKRVLVFLRKKANFE